MSNNKMSYYAPLIEELLENNGPMGVTAISRQLDIPTATVQHYLKSSGQKKIIQLPNKKWSLRPKLETVFDKEIVRAIKSKSIDELIIDYHDLKNNIKIATERAEVLYLYIQEKLDGKL